MQVKRGDIILAFFPHPVAPEGKRRPVLVVQSDSFNRILQNAIVAEVTGNLAHGGDPTHLLIDVATAEGKATGLLRSSVISCLNLAVLPESRLDRVIGHLPEPLLRKIDACLKAALGLP